MHENSLNLFKKTLYSSILIILVTNTTQKCVKTASGCDLTSDPTCSPIVAVGDDTIPKIFTYAPGESVCPDYDGKLSCCNNNVMADLRANYGLIDQELGDPSNGCGICGTNMKRFW